MAEEEQLEAGRLGREGISSNLDWVIDSKLLTGCSWKARHCLGPSLEPRPDQSVSTFRL